MSSACICVLREREDVIDDLLVFSTILLRQHRESIFNCKTNKGTKWTGRKGCMTVAVLQMLESLPNSSLIFSGTSRQEVRSGKYEEMGLERGTPTP